MNANNFIWIDLEMTGLNPDRNLDVSTLKTLCERWSAALAKGVRKQAKHRALDDIRESIDELAYYREHFIRLP